jgi:hypothetical protein
MIHATQFAKPPRCANLLIFAIAACLAGCNDGDLRDGLYTTDSNARAKNRMKILAPGMVEKLVAVREYSDFSPREVLTLALPANEGFQVQLNGSVKRLSWTEDQIAIVIGGKAYLELGRMGPEVYSDQGKLMVPASINVKVRSVGEARTIAERLHKRYHIDWDDRL